MCLMIVLKFIFLYVHYHYDYHAEVMTSIVIQAQHVQIIRWTCSRWNIWDAFLSYPSLVSTGSMNDDDDNDDDD
jgi:nicotinamide riboside transporter PnuC